MTQAITATATTVFPQAQLPTMYFIGMTTAKSSIMKVFPHWAEYLKLGDVRIQGIDCRWHDDPAVYRRVVEFVSRDPLSKGALVTTHKLDLLKACRDMFGVLDPYAELMGEISSISKSDGRLIGHAKDPITSGLAMQAFLPPGYFSQIDSDVLLLGAGGSSIALSSYLMDSARGADHPRRILVSDLSPQRLDEMRHVHGRMIRTMPVSYHHAPRPEDNDALMSALRPGSLVINATGLGKDGPGSPITGDAVFPQNGYAWDFNYRGDLVFLKQARAQKNQRRLYVVDGWVYFLHGWTRVIAEVFQIEIPTSGPVFDTLSLIAREAR